VKSGARQASPSTGAVSSDEARIDPDVIARARLLFGSDPTLTACHGGRNSRVYRVDRAGERFALKFYPPDGRWRVEREYAAVSFFADAQIWCVPRPVCADVSHNAAVYTWLDGQAVSDANHGDIDALAAFASKLHALRGLSGADIFKDAAEACYAPATILGQIDTRLERLAGVSGEPALEEFLRAQFAPVLSRESARPSLPKGPAASVQRTLSPSDFGLHNALRTAAGELSFLDFEYFGWDDPVKLVCDVCWHPGMALRDGLRARFIERCRDIYADGDAAWDARMAAAYPLYGLRWCLIVLNEFVPTLWHRRVAAGVDGLAPGVRGAQLLKAQALLKRIAEHADGTAFGY
jgi:hypothetical protein